MRDLRLHLHHVSRSINDPGMRTCVVDVTITRYMLLSISFLAPANDQVTFIYALCNSHMRYMVEYRKSVLIYKVECIYVSE